MREIRCAACGTLNRVRDYSFTRVPQCGKDGCGATLPEPAQTKIVRYLYRFRSQATPLLLTAGVLTFLWFISQGERSTQSTIPAKSEPTVSCVAQATPPQGEYESTNSSPRVAPFKITTAAGFNYLVKIESTHDFFISTSFFVYGGVPFETEVPLGVYVLKYAAGITWCGRQNLFGKDTFAKKGETLLVFDQEGNGYGGQEVTLIAERGGNFRTEYIKLSEF